MLGLKREIIKERDAAGDVGEGGQRRFRLETQEVMQTGVTWTWSRLSMLFPTGTARGVLTKFPELQRSTHSEQN